MKHAKLITVLAATLALGACGKGATFGDGPAAPSGARDLIVRVQTSGGFLPPGADQVSVPEFTLISDGRIVVGGPQIEIYPGPAMPNMQQRTVTDAGIDAILAEASDAGLLGPDQHYGNDRVADAGTTVFTVVADGKRHVISVYALGLEAETGARGKLQKFRDRLSDLSSWLPAGSLGEEKTYEFDALRVVAREASDNADDSVKPNELDWPLSSLDTFGAPVADARCGVVDGDDLDTVLPRVRQATQITLWHSGSKTFNLQFRPQLPDETACEITAAPSS